MAVVTGINVLGIQRHVFASNQLRDVLAASWMVDHITNRMPDSLLQWGVAADQVLLAAGGNAIIEFESLADARTWTAQYTRWLYDEAPGLDVVVAHRPYKHRSLAWGLKVLSVDLARAKLDRRPNSPQLGLSVTASCSMTGLPAVSLDRHDLMPISGRIARLREGDVQTHAKDRWDPYLPSRLEKSHEWRAEFPVEMDLMGRTHGDTSLVGVVHLDGNDVGKAINDWLDRCYDEEVGDETVRTEYRVWSGAIDELGKSVLQTIVQRIACRVRSDENEHGDGRYTLRGTPDELGFPLRVTRDEEIRSTTPDTLFLPLRPVLLGGDDLTFVCDGRIALDLAIAALREFRTYEIPHLGENGGTRTLTACAGIALVGAHAPFHRSYDLAESLCSSAKRTRLDVNQRIGAETGCWLDWHIGSTRPAETVEDMRWREYQEGALTMRPYPLAHFKGREQSWQWLDDELLGPNTTAETEASGLRGAPCWTGSRSRVKRLGSLVPAGMDGIKRQVDAWKVIEDGVLLPARLPDGGFVGQQTPLLDAIELLDLHTRLEPDPRVACTNSTGEDMK